MKKLLLSAVFNALALPSYALTVDELSDFSDGASPSNTNVGTLDIGFNSFNGNLNGECSNGDCNGIGSQFDDTQDSILFTVASGTEVISFSLFTEGGGPSGLTISAAIFGTIGVSDIGAFQSVINVPINGNADGTLVNGPLGAGVYSLSAYGGSSTDDGGFGAFWSIDLEVAEVTNPVPLPAGLPLLLAGVGAFGLMRRRARN